MVEDKIEQGFIANNVIENWGAGAFNGIKLKGHGDVIIKNNRLSSSPTGGKAIYSDYNFNVQLIENSINGTLDLRGAKQLTPLYNRKWTLMTQEGYSETVDEILEQTFLLRIDVASNTALCGMAVIKSDPHNQGNMAEKIAGGPDLIVVNYLANLYSNPTNKIILGVGYGGQLSVFNGFTNSVEVSVGILS